MKPTELEFREARNTATDWAKEALSCPDTVILDTETTGLPTKDPDTEICQLSIVNMMGRPLFSMLIKPAKRMSNEVIEIHKITNEQVENQPTFPQIAKIVSFVLEGKSVICYNSGFDVKLLWSLFKKYNVPVPKVKSISCAMERYSEFKGEWDEKRDRFKWHKLPCLAAGQAHDSLTDCVSTLKLLQLIAGDFDPQAVEAEEISLDF